MLANLDCSSINGLKIFLILVSLLLLTVVLVCSLRRFTMVVLYKLLAKVTMDSEFHIHHWKSHLYSIFL